MQKLRVSNCNSVCGHLILDEIDWLKTIEDWQHVRKWNYKLMWFREGTDFFDHASTLGEAGISTKHVANHQNYSGPKLGLRT